MMQDMTPSPSAPARPSNNRRPTANVPPITLTEAFAEAFLPRSVTRKPILHGRSGSSPDPKTEQKRTNVRKEVPSLTKPLTPNDGNCVRDKVRRWHDEGGGVVDNSALAGFLPNEPTPQGLSRASRKQTDHQARPMEEQRDDNTGIKTTTKDRTDPSPLFVGDRPPRPRKPYSPATPKKRVVSDEHWMKDRRKHNLSPEKNTSANSKRSRRVSLTGTANTTLVESPGSGAAKTKIRHDRDGEPPALEDPDSGLREDRKLLEESHEKCKLRTGRHRRESATSKDDDNKYEQPTISRKPPASPPAHPRTRPRKRSTPKSCLPSQPAVEVCPKEADGLQVRHQSKKTREISQSNEHVYSPKEGFQSDTYAKRDHILENVSTNRMEAVHLSTSCPASRPAPNRIEAWLDDTEDPFIEDQLISGNGKPSPKNRRLQQKESTQDFIADSKIDDTRSESTSSKMRKRRLGKHQTGTTTKEPQFSLHDRGLECDLDDIALAAVAPELEKLTGTTSPLRSSIMRRGGAKTRPSRERHSKHSSLPNQESPTDVGKPPPSVVVEPRLSRQSRLSMQSVLDARKVSRQSSQLSMDPAITTASLRHLERAVNDDARSPRDSGTGSGYRVQDVADPTLQESVNMATMISDAQDSQHLNVASSYTSAPLIDSQSPQRIPHVEIKSVESTPSVRTAQSKVAATNITAVMDGLATDEYKYARELHTLVEGVVPVLLSCVLSKSDSAIAAALYGTTFGHVDGPNFTRAIIDMGTVLERLKSLHKRIPLNNPDRLLQWARGAQRVYEEYIDCWRFGFENVVINMGTPNDIKAEPALETNPDEGMAQNAEGDIVDANGNCVDVAHLSKRPLVRLKRLWKTFKDINALQPSPLAQEHETKFHGLFTKARSKVRQEEARLDDEEAATIDPSLAKDPHTLDPAPTTTIDPSRLVMLKDMFSLYLRHSSGQTLTCRVLLFLRENESGNEREGDILVCELQQNDCHLLFPPIPRRLCSAVAGKMPGELTLMLRGNSHHGEEWQEILSLFTDEPWACRDWVDALGSNPLPPATGRYQSFETIGMGSASSAAAQQHQEIATSEVIGEQHTAVKEETLFIATEHSGFRANNSKSRGRALSNKSRRGSRSDNRNGSLVLDTSPDHADDNLSSRILKLQAQGLDAKQASGAQSQRLRRYNAKRKSKISTQPRPVLSTPESSFMEGDTLEPPVSAKENESHLEQISSENDRISPQTSDRHPKQKPIQKFKPLPVAFEEARVGKHSDGRANLSVDSNSTHHLQSATIPKIPTGQHNRQGLTPNNTIEASVPVDHSLDADALASAKRHESSSVLLQETPSNPKHTSVSLEQDTNMAIPLIRNSAAIQQTITLETSGLTPKRTGGRRVSSPLKHEYAPSNLSDDSNSDSRHLTTVLEESSIDSSDAEEPESEDVLTPLTPVAGIPQSIKGVHRDPAGTFPTPTLAPSDSASQGPYRGVPIQANQNTKAIASVFSWSNQKGAWEKIHPDECSVVVSAGLIEVFRMTAAHSTPGTREVASGEEGSASEDQTNNKDILPLISQELTPLVGVDRGTALDISIRSPITARSTFKCGYPIMFRSRNARESQELYLLAQVAMRSNPTYVALQQARHGFGGCRTSSLRRRTSGRRRVWRGWHWKPRRVSSSTQSFTVPSVGDSEGSMGASVSILSSLKRLTQDLGVLETQKSSVSPRGRQSTRASVDSFTSVSTPTRDGFLTPSRHQEIAISIANFKCKLFERAETQWRFLGSGLLIVDRPPPPEVFIHADEKRIIFQGEQGNTLLDVTLGKDSFRMDGRTGINFEMHEEVSGPDGRPGATGGLGIRSRKYLIRMKGEAEAAHVYSLVGRL